MDGAYYGLSILAIFIIITWCVSNDRLPPGKPTKGLLAMKPDRLSGELRIRQIT